MLRYTMEGVKESFFGMRSAALLEPVRGRNE